MLLLASLFGLFGYFRIAGKIRLQQAIAEADRLDPGWRLAELEAKLRRR